MRFRIAFVAACLAVCSVGVGEDLFSGRQFLKNIEVWEKGLEINSNTEWFLDGALLGTVNTTMFWSRGLGINTPNGATVEQFVRIIKKYLNEHPERLHERAEILIRDALLEAFGPYPPPK